MKENLQLLKEKMKQLVLKALSIPKMILIQLLLGIKAVLCHPLIIGTAALTIGFVSGARMHEVGALAGFLGKTFKGSTVYLSGSCKVNGVVKLPALARDQVLVTSEDVKAHKISGVILKTRELIDCDTNDVALDKIALLSHLKDAPIDPPSLDSITKEVKEPEWKKLIQKTLVMTGSCLGVDGRKLPPFLDEQVDVTNVQVEKDNPDSFIISGIKKADKIAIACPNTAVKYAIYEKNPSPVITSVPVPAKPKSYIGETILVTSTCFPDPRTPKHEQAKKVAFYPFVNNRVQVTEEELDTNGNFKKLAGAALDFGAMVVCDASKFPLTWKPYDPDSMKLTPIKANNKFDLDGSASGSVIEPISQVAGKVENPEATAKVTKEE